MSIVAILGSRTDQFYEPWNAEGAALNIDPYEKNTIAWGELKASRQLCAIIHRATIGLKQADKKYGDRRKKALASQYLWGSYHLGTRGKPIEQADFYLSTVSDIRNEVIAIDFEDIDSEKFMSLEDAEVFIERIFEKKGRYPLIYCNNSVFEKINSRRKKESVLGKCGLWYARFRKDIPSFNNSIWSSYTLWQFPSEINCKKTGGCLVNVSGIQFDMDVNVYNGSVEDLKLKWPNI